MTSSNNEATGLFIGNGLAEPGIGEIFFCSQIKDNIQFVEMLNLRKYQYFTGKNRKIRGMVINTIFLPSRSRQ